MAGTAQGRVEEGAYGTSGGVTGTAVGGTNQTIEFNAGTVSLVQYEPGTVATPFEHRSPIGRTCLVPADYESGTVFAVSYGASGTFVQRVQYPFKVNKRAATTSVVVSSGSLTAPAVVASTSTLNVNIGYSSTAAGVEGVFSLTVESEL